MASELANIKANQLSGDQKVQLSGTIMELTVQRLMKDPRKQRACRSDLHGGQHTGRGKVMVLTGGDVSATTIAVLKIHG